MRKRRALLLVFALASALASAGRKTSLRCQQLLATGPLGADVASVYPNVKIRLGLRGEPIVPVGSKAFAYWRERTPSWIPDTAFAVQYLKQNEVRDSVAIHSAAEAEDAAIMSGKAKLRPEERALADKAAAKDSTREPIREVPSVHELIPPPETRVANLKALDPMFFSAAEMKQRWDAKVAAEGEMHPEDRLGLGKTEYIHVDGVPGHEFVFFFYDEGMTHERAKRILLDTYPEAKINFGGSLVFRAKKYSDGSYSIVHLDIGDGAWFTGHWANAEETLGRMLLAVDAEFNLDRETTVRVSGGWSQAYGSEDKPYKVLINQIPLTLNSRMREAGLLTSSEVQKVVNNYQPEAGKILPKLVRPGHDLPSVGYVCFRRPGEGLEMIFFPKKAEQFHQYAFQLVEQQYPGTKLLFGGSMILNFKGEHSEIDFISINGDGFLRDPALEGIDSLRAALDGLGDHLHLFGDSRLLILDSSWVEHPTIKATGSLPVLTIEELKEALKLQPGPERDQIIKVDLITGEYHINKDAPEYKQWRSRVSDSSSDNGFVYELIPEAEYEANSAKQGIHREKKAIEEVEQKIKFIDLKSGNATVKIPEDMADYVKPIKDIFTGVPGNHSHDVVSLKYTIFHIEKEFLVLAWDMEGPNHGPIISALIKANPNLRIVWGDIVSVTYESRRDGSGKLASVSIKENGGRMMLEDYMDQHFESNEWRQEFQHDTQVSDDSILKHQIVQGLKPVIDDETIIDRN